MKTYRSVLTVLGKDRPGIIAEVTGALFRSGCNLEDISMTILEGEFAMIVVVCLSKKARTSADRELRKFAKKFSFTLFWKELRGSVGRGKVRSKGVKTYLVSAIGRDKTGIVYKVSRVLAEHTLNITDLNSRILGTAGKTLYAMVLEVEIPVKFSVGRLERIFTSLSKSLKVEIRIRPHEQIEF